MFIFYAFYQIPSMSFRLVNFIIQFSHNYDAICVYVVLYFRIVEYLELNTLCVCTAVRITFAMHMSKLAIKWWDKLRQFYMALNNKSFATGTL